MTRYPVTPPFPTVTQGTQVRPRYPVTPAFKGVTGERLTHRYPERFSMSTTEEIRAALQERRNHGLKQRHEQRIRRGTWMPFDEWVKRYEAAKGQQYNAQGLDGSDR